MSDMQGLGSLNGLASGIDTEGAIQQMLRAGQQPIQRLQQQKAAQETIDEAWTEMASKLAGVRDAVEAGHDRASFDELVRADSSDDQLVTATANGPNADGELTFSVEQLARSHQLAGGSFAGADSDVGAGDFTVEWDDGTTQTLNIADGTTLDELADRITNEVDGVDAQSLRFADGDHRLLLDGEHTGAEQGFAVTATPDGFDAGFDTLREAADAELAMGGATITRESNRIDDLLEDVTVELHQAAPGDEVTVSAGRDVDAAGDRAVGLVDAVSQALSKLGELTAADSDGEEVETGPLQADPTARRIADRLRSTLTESRMIDGETTTAADVGIEVDRYGDVNVDEAALREAFENDFDRAAAFFGGDGTTDGEQPGLAGALLGRLDTIEGAGGQIERARDAVERRIDAHDDRIERHEQRLQDREQTLREQFTQMETRMAELQQMQSRMQQALGGMA